MFRFFNLVSASFLIFPSSVNPWKSHRSLSAPLKISEKKTFSDVFRGYRKKIIAPNELKRATSNVPRNFAPLSKAIGVFLKKAFLSIFSQPKFCHLNEIIYYHISSNKNLGKDFEKFITKLKWFPFSKYKIIRS